MEYTTIELTDSQRQSRCGSSCDHQPEEIDVGDFVGLQGYLGMEVSRQIIPTGLFMTLKLKYNTIRLYLQPNNLCRR